MLREACAARRLEARTRLMQPFVCRTGDFLTASFGYLGILGLPSYLAGAGARLVSSSANSALASVRSFVAKPSLNQA